MGQLNLFDNEIFNLDYEKKFQREIRKIFETKKSITIDYHLMRHLLGKVPMKTEDTYTKCMDDLDEAETQLITNFMDTHKRDREFVESLIREAIS